MFHIMFIYVSYVSAYYFYICVFHNLFGALVQPYSIGLPLIMLTVGPNVLHVLPQRWLNMNPASDPKHVSMLKNNVNPGCSTPHTWKISRKITKILR